MIDVSDDEAAPPAPVAPPATPPRPAFAVTEEEEALLHFMRTDDSGRRIRDAARETMELKRAAMKQDGVCAICRDKKSGPCVNFNCSCRTTYCIGCILVDAPGHRADDRVMLANTWPWIHRKCRACPGCRENTDVSLVYI